MAYFYVRIDGMEQTAAELDHIAQQVNGEVRGIMQIGSSVENSSEWREAKTWLYRLASELSAQGHTLYILSGQLSEITQQYKMTERRLEQSEPGRAETQDAGQEATQETWQEEAINFIYQLFQERMKWEAESLSYVGKSLWQVLAGNAAEETTALGTVLSIVVGFIPVVGQIADARDVIIDIVKLIDDGPEASEWISLGFSLVAFIPGIGDVAKNGDEILPALKSIGKYMPELSKGTAKVVDKLQDVAQAICDAGVGKYLDDLGRQYDTYIKDPVMKQVDEWVDHIPGEKYIQKLLEQTIMFDNTGRDFGWKWVEKQIQNRILSYAEQRQRAMGR